MLDSDGLSSSWGADLSHSSSTVAITTVMRCCSLALLQLFVEAFGDGREKRASGIDTGDPGNSSNIQIKPRSKKKTKDKTNDKTKL